MGRTLDALTDPVSAIHTGFLSLCGVGLAAMGVFDLIRKFSIRAARKKTGKPSNRILAEP